MYRAWDPRLTRDVALKLLNVEHADAQAFERSVITEGRLPSRGFRHPNVIAVYGADSHDGRVGFWMEFLEGRTLKNGGCAGAHEFAGGGGVRHRHLPRARRRPPRRASPSRRQGAERHARGRRADRPHGLRHRRRVGPRRAPGRHTPLIAPELFADAPATPRTDLYSVGVLLFYLVSGSFPVSGVTLSDIKQAHASGRRQTLRDVRPDLPAAFVRVVDWALSPDPAGRPATAGALEADLTTSLELLTATPALCRRRSTAAAPDMP